MTRFAIAALLMLVATPSFAMELASPDVTQGKPFATKFVCAKFGGTSISPALSWSGVPAGTKSLAVTMFDPDAGTVGLLALAGGRHAAGHDRPRTRRRRRGQRCRPDQRRSPMARKQPSYAGPCPPPGKPHHYQITALRPARRQGRRRREHESLRLSARISPRTPSLPLGSRRCMRRSKRLGLSGGAGGLGCHPAVRAVLRLICFRVVESITPDRPLLALAGLCGALGVGIAAAAQSSGRRRSRHRRQLSVVPCARTDRLEPDGRQSDCSNAGGSSSLR